MKTKEQLAKELANSLESIKNIECPRDVINPGLYFGFIKGWEQKEDKIKEMISAYEFNREACVSKIKALKQELEEECSTGRNLSVVLQDVLDTGQKQLDEANAKIGTLERKLTHLKEQGIIDEQY